MRMMFTMPRANPDLLNREKGLGLSPLFPISFERRQKQFLCAALG
jgi:hypothetical protein